MRLLIDANLGRKFTGLLKLAGHDAVYVNDLLPKASDEEILSFAKRENRIVITNDKDFGELIFKLGVLSTGIILLRTLTTDPEKRFDMIKDVLSKSEGRFVVVKEGQIRTRYLI